jgi:hypothetical protein
MQCACSSSIAVLGEQRNARGQRTLGRAVDCPEVGSVSNGVDSQGITDARNEGICKKLVEPTLFGSVC